MAIIWRVYVLNGISLSILEERIEAILVEVAAWWMKVFRRPSWSLRIYLIEEESFHLSPIFSFFYFQIHENTIDPKSSNSSHRNHQYSRNDSTRKDPSQSFFAPHRFPISSSIWLPYLFVLFIVKGVHIDWWSFRRKNARQKCS